MADTAKRLIIRQTTPTPYRTTIEVIDPDSGEVLFSKREDDIKAAFAAGEMFATAELTVVRDITEEGGEMRSVCLGDEVVCGGWRNKRYRKRGGKKSYVKIYPERINELPNKMALAVIRLAPFVRVDGYLNGPSNKRRAKKAEDLFAIWGLSSSAGYEMLAALRERSLIVKDDGGFNLDKKLMGRG